MVEPWGRGNRVWMVQAGKLRGKKNKINFTFIHTFNSAVKLSGKVLWSLLKDMRKLKQKI